MISILTTKGSAGGIVIACANVLTNQGYNLYKNIIVVCSGIDEVAARMCYLHLASLRFPAIVNIGNSLYKFFKRCIRRC